MSYALGSTPQRANAIAVGARAKDDVILARASLVASGILSDAVKRRSQGQRLGYIRRRLARYAGGDAPARFDRRRRGLLSRGWAPNQATYDAMRLAIANHLADKGMMAIRTAMADKYGADRLVGLGDDEAKAIGCGITGGVTGIIGLVGSIYGGSGGATAAGTAGSLVGGALDCGAASREAQQRIAAAQAAAAQAQANAALQTAQAQERAAQEKTKQVTVIIAATGGLILLLGAGYAIMKA